jgi:predicted RNA binding protein YcfA (HicA-like mRNA interferase family)
MKVRDLRSALRQIGCKPLRCKGSHEVWSSPSGATLPPLVINHVGDEASVGVYAKIVRALRSEGIELRADGTFALAS